jgi:phage tail sheath protein FI
MAIVESIGVISREKDQSQFAQIGSPLIPAMVIFSTWGPANVLTDITKVIDLDDTFGQPLSVGHLGLVAAQKYLSNGNLLRLVKVSSSSDTKATESFVDSESGTSLVVEAKYAGAYGNKIGIKVSTESAKKRIDVFVNGVLRETYKNLSKGSGEDKNANYKEVITGTSKWIFIPTNVTADAETNEPKDVDTVLLSSGTTVLPTKADFVGTATGGPGGRASGLQIFASDAVKIDCLLCPDGATLSSEDDIVDIMTEIMSIASSRRDFLGLVDIPAGSSVSEAIAFANTTAAYNSTFVSCSWPWAETSVSSLSSAEATTRVYLPGSVLDLIAIANNDRSEHPWYGAFGYNRGVLTQFTDVEYNSSKGDRDLLEGAQINPIIKEDGVGVVYLGNLTKYATAQATQSKNVRRMLLTLKKLLDTALKSLIGEPNDVVSREQFKSIVEKILEFMKEKRAVEDFLVICDDTTNTPATSDVGRLVGVIKLQPIKSTRIIDLTFEVSPTGVGFTE